MKIALLNTAILTAFGEFSYQPLSLENAKALIETHGYESFIGHQSTADVLSELLGIDVPVHRGEYIQQGRMIAIVFKLNARIDVPRELTIEDINEVGYTLGVLARTDFAS